MPRLPIPKKKSHRLILAAALALLLLTVKVSRVEQLVKTRQIFLPWGSGPRSVALYQAPDGKRFGPSDFFAQTTNALLLLDTFNDRILKIKGRTVSVAKQVPRGTVDFAYAKGKGFYLADDLSRRLILPNGSSVPYPASEVVRTLELKAAPSGGAYLLLASYGIQGPQTTLYYVGNQGALKSLARGVKSVAPMSGGGLVWSDGSVIHRFGVQYKLPGKLEGSDGSRLVFLSQSLGHANGRITVVGKPPVKWLSVPQSTYAELGRYASATPSGLVLAYAQKNGLRLTWYKVTRHLALSLRI